MSKPGAAPPGRVLGPQFAPPPRAAYAARPALSRGRLYPEQESATRTCYQRDRDRIIHSAAFRRLKHKTQVFVQHEGDYYRTRLTHSLEVSQIARSLARVFGLDEDLAEALALAHDLGHPPFGHAGEAALDACMKDFGGFDHNAQALALVTRLEHRYARFDGLNLTWETLEGLVKHNGPLIGAGRPPGCLPAGITAFPWDLELASHAGLEAQLAALADDIAYVNHDIDDGLRAGVFEASELFESALAGPIFRAVSDANPGLELGRLIGESVRRVITLLIDGLITETRARLDRLGPQSAAEVRNLGEPLVGFSAQIAHDIADLKAFLFRRMYRHPRIVEVLARAQKVLSNLFSAYMADPGLLPEDWSRACSVTADARTARVVCDYVAGMTDNFALQEYRRIFHIEFPL
jgi:dGTPase